MQVFKIIEQDGRYIWTVNPATMKTSGFGFSPITFATKEAAEADLHIYLKSQPDGEGRTIRTQTQLASLLKVAAETCPECDGFSLPTPQRQEADANGCTWHVAADTAGISGCISCMEHAITALQAAYNISEEM